MYCTQCGYNANDTDKFCKSCGYSFEKAAPPAYSPPGAAFLPQGISQNENGDLTWQGECRAISYKPIFTVCRWVVGTLGAIAIIIVMIIYGSSITENLAPLIITAGIIAAVYLISSGCLIGLRNGKFRAAFRLSEDKVTADEISSEPESGIAAFLTLLVGLFGLIGGLINMFSDDVSSDLAAEEHDKSISRQVKYTKIKSVVPAADKSYIILKKKLGSMKLLVTPEQCDYIVGELKLRCQREQ